MRSGPRRPVLLRLALGYVLHGAHPRMHAAPPRQTKHKFSCTSADPLSSLFRS